MKHPEIEKLVKNFEGLLSLAEQREVSEHLNVCAKCASLGAKLEDFFSYVYTFKNEQVSQADTARLLNIFKPKKNVAKGKFSGKRLVASLIFDDWQMIVNERFAANDTRHLLFKAERFEIDLRIHFFGGKWQVSGQIFPDYRKSATVEIYSEEMSEKVFLNNYCEFVFPPVQEGIYNLRISLEETILEIENLSLFN